jgi:MoxR-like ATPase
MLRNKMLQVMNEVNAQVAERADLIALIAIALLTRKNLFILGDTGQAKSFAINAFRKHITDARQFERLMSKQSDEEQLFGRLDLASLIPGGVPRDVLMRDADYGNYYKKLGQIYDNYRIDGEQSSLDKAVELIASMRQQQEVLSVLNGNKPTINTTGKIPDSHLVFLDEIFKANDGILNSLLTALNERVYTNEGETVDIPVISFFSASNEIPNFTDPAEKILKPLYDRFDLKIVTQYVQDRETRLNFLAQKQKAANGKNAASMTQITLNDLLMMQTEVKNIGVSMILTRLLTISCANCAKGGFTFPTESISTIFPLRKPRRGFGAAARYRRPI